MERMITIDGVDYRLVTNAFTPIAYKNEFGRDYFQEMLSMFENEQMMVMLQQSQEGQEEQPELDMSAMKNFDMTFFQRLFWMFAKSGNPQLEPFQPFFEKMESFPVADVAPVLVEMLEQNLITKKKSMSQQMQAQTSSPWSRT